jgi:L-ascorbate 6-phosphate lactonase
MLHLHRLAQAGFLLRASGTTLVIDAFLSSRPDRLVPPGVAPQDVVGGDAIPATHKHPDHLERDSVPALAAASRAAITIVPSPIVDQVRQVVAAERVVGATVDGTIEVGAARIVPVPVRHGVTMADAYTFGRELSGGLYRYLGYVVDLGCTATKISRHIRPVISGASSAHRRPAPRACSPWGTDRRGRARS